MNFEQALTYELQAINGLGGKVFPQSAPEGTTTPFVVYFSSEGEKIMTLSGPTDLTELNCEIHIVTESYSSLKDMTKAVLERIKSFFQRKIGLNGPLIKSISHVEPTEDMDNALNFHTSTFNIRVHY